MATTMPPSNIFHLVDTSIVKVECGISEEKKRSITLGKEAIIELDAYPKEVFIGKITTVNPKVDINTRTFKIKIEIPNKNLKLEAGMFARIRIIEKESKDALLIPQRAIIEQEASKKVFIVEDSRALEKSISTGIIDRNLVEVLEGLAEDDIVVTEGFYALKDGIKVTVKELSDQGVSSHEST
jgi:RND family efflux transporter MFP subunit